MEEGSFSASPSAHVADATETEARCDLEEALRLAEVGEYLYDAKSFKAGDGYHEPREFSINWEWQQHKPDTYGEGALLAEAVAWHEEMRAEGIETQAYRLRRSLAAAPDLLEALKLVTQSTEWPTMERDTQDAVLAAIAKAEAAS